MSPHENRMEPSNDLLHEDLPPVGPSHSIAIQFTETRCESTDIETSKKHTISYQGSKGPASSSRKSHDTHTHRRSEARGANRGSTVIQRDIIPTKSNRDLMRQISGLGMIDPVYGTREASPLHQSIIFDDMSLGDIPDDFKDAVSVASDRTATDGNGFDSTFFTASLLFSADDLPSLDGSSVSKNTKKTNWKVHSSDAVDFDSLLSGNGRSSPVKFSMSKTKDAKPPLPDHQFHVNRSKPQEIAVKPISSKEAHREIPASADFFFSKQTLHNNSSQVPLPTSPRKSSISHKPRMSPRKLPSIAQIFPGGRPPRRATEANSTDPRRNTSSSLSAPKL
ncbi:hypothetical protein FisN_7Hh195 [Fistulifera solaris]|uniref:Uncharacterized protein n=1 Tax=Fistulifera solaris TaxID=1519565 RepID=A0A1Z5K3U6_FISSO|nr:hypothetical protein FisN_7Hh195 [Fistulifera solaris]|eukprot:GAX20876.1 hypothetical protein FisN_7Hh195 [Fistulifera solaris]